MNLFLHERCLRCGRKLKDTKYQQIGFGACCYKKYLQENKLSSKKLFNMEDIKEM